MQFYKAILLIFIISVQLFADFRVVHVDGGNLSSTKQTTVSILEEKVLVKLYRDTCKVTCKFWVKSTNKNEYRPEAGRPSPTGEGNERNQKERLWKAPPLSSWERGAGGERSKSRSKKIFFLPE
jgi:hypothetical protein